MTPTQLLELCSSTEIEQLMKTLGIPRSTAVSLVLAASPCPPAPPKPVPAVHKSSVVIGPQGIGPYDSQLAAAVGSAYHDFTVSFTRRGIKRTEAVRLQQRAVSFGEAVELALKERPDCASWDRWDAFDRTANENSGGLLERFKPAAPPTTLKQSADEYRELRTALSAPPAAGVPEGFVAAPRHLLEEAAKWLEVHGDAPSSESYCATDLRDLLAAAPTPPASEQPEPFMHVVLVGGVRTAEGSESRCREWVDAWNNTSPRPSQPAVMLPLWHTSFEASQVAEYWRELDVLLNGEEGAAEQASLCDVVGQVASVVRGNGRPLLADPDAAETAAQVQGEQPEVVGWRTPSGGMHADKEAAEKNVRTGHVCPVEPLMTVAQHQRMLARSEARSAERQAAAEELARLLKQSADEYRELRAALSAAQVQGERERERAVHAAFNDWSWNKKGEAVGRMDGQAAAYEGFRAGAEWQARAAAQPAEDQTNE